MKEFDQQYRGFLVAAAAICLSVLIFSPLVSVIFHLVTVPAHGGLSQYAFDPTEVRPEPAERLCYFASLLFFPIAIPGLILLVERYFGSSEFLFKFDRIASVPVWLYVMALLLGPEAIHLNSWYLKYSVLGLDLPYRMAVFGLFFMAWKWRKLAHHPIAQAGLTSTIVLSLLALGLTCFLRAEDPYMLHPHINAAFYSVVQVYEGRILLHDFYNQYGLYPYFLAPVFRLIGLSIESFSVVMGLLTMLSFGMLLLVLRKGCRSQTLASIGFLACLNFNYFHMKLVLAIEAVISYLDPYFQYWPIRLLFPSLMLLLLCRYFEGRRKLFYWSGMWLLAAGCFWNLDSGVPAWGTWVLTLGYSEFLRPLPWRHNLRRALNHLAIAIGCLLGVAGLVELGLFWLCSQWVSLEGLIHIHKVFYGLGFYMLPMELPHSWALVALLYFAGLAYAFQALRRHHDQLRPKLVFALSIVGLGCFSYFQGRSHDWVLFLASWPASVLAVVFVDELLHHPQTRGRLSIAIYSLLITLLVNFTISLPLSFKGVAPYVKVRLIGQPTEPAGHKLHEEVDFLENQHSRYPKRMIILSNHSALLHQLTDSQFLEFDSFTEMFRLEEWQRLANTIEAETSPWIIVGFDFVEDDLDKSWRQLVNSALQKHYHRIKASSNQRLQIYAPNHAPQTNQGG